MKPRTWMVEAVVVWAVLSGVALLSGGGWRQWLVAVAVLLSFMHAQVADRLAAAEDMRWRVGSRAPALSGNEVACFEWARRYYVAKEVLWALAFASTGAWPALAGCAVFLLYPVWRAVWTSASVREARGIADALERMDDQVLANFPLSDETRRAVERELAQRNGITLQRAKDWWLERARSEGDATVLAGVPECLICGKRHQDPVCVVRCSGCGFLPMNDQAELVHADTCAPFPGLRVPAPYRHPDPAGGARYRLDFGPGPFSADAGEPRVDVESPLAPVDWSAASVVKIQEERPPIVTTVGNMVERDPWGGFVPAFIEPGPEARARYGKMPTPAPVEPPDDPAFAEKVIEAVTWARRIGRL